MTIDLQTVLLVIYGIIATAAAFYFYGKYSAVCDHKNALLAERNDWTNKALARQGLSPLGTETKPREPRQKIDAEITPKVALRGQLEARVMRHPDREERTEAAPPNAKNVTIYAESVSADRLARDTEGNTGSIKDKAKVIFEKLRRNDK